MVGGTSIRRLGHGVALSVRTVGRWVRKAIHQAPKLWAKVAQMCYEMQPALPLSTQVISGPMSVKEQVAAFLVWLELWEELLRRHTGLEAIGGFAAINLVGPVLGMWC